MLGLCGCENVQKFDYCQENLQTNKRFHNFEINSLNASKPHKLIPKKSSTRARAESSDIPDLDTLPIYQKKDFISAKPFLAPPGRKDSDRADSTNLSNTNILELPPQTRSSFHSSCDRPVSLLILDEGVAIDYVNDQLKDGAEVKRNSVTSSGNIIKFTSKYGTGSKFSDFVGFRKYQAKKNTTKNEQVGLVIKSRLPAHRVVSMKEYKKKDMGRAKTLSPKKSILQKKNTSVSPNKLINLSPASKQVTFSKHNTVLIFVKEAQPPQE